MFVSMIRTVNGTALQTVKLHVIVNCWFVSGMGCPSIGGTSQHLCKMSLIHWMTSSSRFACNFPGLKAESLSPRKPWWSRFLRTHIQFRFVVIVTGFILSSFKAVLACLIFAHLQAFGWGGGWMHGESLSTPKSPLPSSVLLILLAKLLKESDLRDF